MARQAIGMMLLHGGTPRDHEALRQLAAVLPEGARAGEPDDLGVFEIELDADDREDALTAVWNAVAAAGVDDHILFLKHPDLPEHWRLRSSRPASV